MTRKQRTAKPGFAIHKSNRGYRLYRDGSACVDTCSPTRSGAATIQTEIIRYEQLCSAFLYPKKKAPVEDRG